ncbi:hypothetical protein Tco_0712750 [Tanacetum coccineum]
MATVPDEVVAKRWGILDKRTEESNSFISSKEVNANTKGVIIGTDISKIIRKQSKASNHGHKNQKNTKRSQRIKAEARKVKPQSNPVKEKSIIFSLEGEARTWLDKEPPRSILTWDDLVLNFDKCTDKSKITRKQSKTSKHGHENLKSTKRSQRIKAEARKVKPQSNPVKENSIIGQQKCLQLDQTATIDAQMIEEMIGQD